MIVSLNVKPGNTPAFLFTINLEIMKASIIFLLLVCSPLILFATEEKQQIRKKSEWYTHMDQRLTTLEERLLSDIASIHQQQAVMNEEMHRLNNKLENRFDKYFLWGYGTLLVVISTLVSVIFNKRRDEKEEDHAD